MSRLFVWLEFCYRVKQISCCEDGWSRLHCCSALNTGQRRGDAEVSWITGKLEITFDLFLLDLSPWFAGPVCPQCTTPPGFSCRVTIWRWRERERRRGLARSGSRTGPWQPSSQLSRRIEINYSYYSKLLIKSPFIRVCHSNDCSYGLTPDCFSSSQHETELKA